MSRFASNIFSTFYQFFGSLPCTVQHVKNSNYLFIEDKCFWFYEKSQNSSFLTMSRVKMGHILPKQKNAPQNFLYGVQYVANY